MSKNREAEIMRTAPHLLQHTSVVGNILTTSAFRSWAMSSAVRPVWSRIAISLSFRRKSSWLISLATPAVFTFAAKCNAAWPSQIHCRCVGGELSSASKVLVRSSACSALWQSIVPNSPHCHLDPAIELLPTQKFCTCSGASKSLQSLKGLGKSCLLYTSDAADE